MVVHAGTNLRLLGEEVDALAVVDVGTRREHLDAERFCHVEAALDLFVSEVFAWL